MDTAMRVAARESEIDAAYRDVAAVAGRLNRAHADLVTLTVRVLAGELWGGDGIRSPEHWLCLYAGLSPARAREVVRLARRAAELPATLAALEAARISVDHAAVVARYAPADHDESVAATAQLATVSQLTRALSRYQFGEASSPISSEESAAGGESNLADDIAGSTNPDPRPVCTADGYPPADPWGPDGPGTLAYASAAPQLSMGVADGRFTLRFSAPADVGVLVEQAIREAKDALFNAGHAAATHAEALIEVATRSLAAVTATGRAARYRTYIHLSVDGGWVGGKGAIPPRLAAKFACDGIIQPLWEKNGLPVSVGREQRIVPDRTRRLIEDRDRGCRFPGCTATRFVEVHHIQHWADGGPTDADTMVCLCPFHHDQHHRGQYSITGNPGLNQLDLTGHPDPHTPSEELTFLDPKGHRIGYRPPPALTIATSTDLDRRDTPTYQGACGYPLDSPWFAFDPPPYATPTASEPPPLRLVDH